MRTLSCNWLVPRGKPTHMRFDDIAFCFYKLKGVSYEVIVGIETRVGKPEKVVSFLLEETLGFTDVPHTFRLKVAVMVLTKPPFCSRWLFVEDSLIVNNLGITVFRAIKRQTGTNKKTP